ncbi:C39 family peptidase [Priestia endophytica]|uniref:Peptidase C39-like domain-containing protein n=1 Tax=Priestia endophytica TaxID=135735 RepID=A0AAX1Q863_9BACI|nr:C39 family peptidase [Priestia endophytica]RAS75502.1 hypothetical protein A3864_16035 [Priestia endophytica]
MKIGKALSAIGLGVLMASTYLPSVEAAEQPDRLTTRDRGGTSLTYNIHEIEKVPSHKQAVGDKYDANCALIALTNLILYWDQKYPQLVGTDDWTRVENRLAALSNFDKQGTFYRSQYKPVLEEFIAEHGLSNYLEVKVIQNPTYEDVERYVSQGYPVQLSFNNYSYGAVKGFGDNHSVIIKGVVRMGNVKNVILRSGWKPVPDNAYHRWDDLQAKEQISVIVRK